jgi:hypothetical protein
MTGNFPEPLSYGNENPPPWDGTIIRERFSIIWIARTAQHRGEGNQCPAYRGQSSVTFFVGHGIKRYQDLVVVVGRGTAALARTSETTYRIPLRNSLTWHFVSVPHDIHRSNLFMH